MEIPKTVLKEAKGLIELYGVQFGYLGKYKGKDGYVFHFPENEETGFPFVFLYNPLTDEAETVTGFDALDIMDEFN